MKNNSGKQRSEAKIALCWSEKRTKSDEKTKRSKKNFFLNWIIHLGNSQKLISNVFYEKFCCFLLDLCFFISLCSGIMEIVNMQWEIVALVLPCNRSLIEL